MSLFGRTDTPSQGGPSTSSLFGGTQQQPQTPSLFGASQTPATGGGLFGASQQPTPAASTSGSSLFGGSLPATTASSGGGGLFSGGLPAAATPAPVSGGLFSTLATAPSPSGAASAGGLFGNTAATTTAPAAAQPAGGLFGNTSATTPAATTAQSAGGLFGAGAVAPAAGGELFGGRTTQQPPKPSLFPVAATSAATPNTALLAGPAPATPKPGGLFGGTALGATQVQQPSQQLLQQNTVPAVTIDASKLMPTTRFGDCHANVQRILESIEHEIQEQLRIATDLATRSPNHRAAIGTIPSDTSILAHRLSTTKSFLCADEIALDATRAHHVEDDSAATLSIRNVDLFRAPLIQRNPYLTHQHFSQPMRENDITSNKPVLTYFNTQIASMDMKYKIFLDSVQEVELSLRSVEDQATVGEDGIGGVAGEDPTGITGCVAGRQGAVRLNKTLREFNDALKHVSGRIVDVKDGMRELKVIR